MIEQVLFNLVENAQKHTPPGTPIRIRARAWPAVIEIAVADRGPGLPPGEEQRVFDKFHRAQEEPAQSGFGLGLAICKTIVEAQAAKLARATSPRRRRFRFSLPLEAETLRREGASREHPRDRGRSADQRFLGIALETHDYALEAPAGTEGCAGTLQQPDIIIVDLGLPDISGLDVIAKLRGWYTRPILVLSARNQETDKVAALDLGADDYLTKPFGIGELLARLRVAQRHSVTHDAAEAPARVTIGNLVVDFAARRVQRDGADIHLTPIEYKLLTTLVQHRGRVMTHRLLLREVWGASHVESPQHLRIYMRALRHKTDPARPRLLLTGLESAMVCGCGRGGSPRAGQHGTLAPPVSQACVNTILTQPSLDGEGSSCFAIVGALRKPGAFVSWRRLEAADSSSVANRFPPRRVRTVAS